MPRRQKPARVLTIAGLDPCAGAGLTADVRVVQTRGGEVASVATCLTVQNRHGFVRAEPVGDAWLREAIDAVFSDGPVDAVKIGMIAAASSVDVLASALASHDVPVVIDPVMSSTAPGWDGDGEFAQNLRDELLPLAAVITPNQRELAELGAIEDLTPRCAVLVTGGDAAGDDVLDVLHEGGDVVEFRNPRVTRAAPVHGTGCALSTLVAFYLGGGADVRVACGAAIQDVRHCIAATPDADDGTVVPLRVV